MAGSVAVAQAAVLPRDQHAGCLRGRRRPPRLHQAGGPLGRLRRHRHSTGARVPEAASAAHLTPRAADPPESFRTAVVHAVPRVGAGAGSPGPGETDSGRKATPSTSRTCTTGGSSTTSTRARPTPRTSASGRSSSADGSPPSGCLPRSSTPGSPSASCRRRCWPRPAPAREAPCCSTPVSRPPSSAAPGGRTCRSRYTGWTRRSSSSGRVTSTRPRSRRGDRGRRAVPLSRQAAPVRRRQPGFLRRACRRAAHPARARLPRRRPITTGGERGSPRCRGHRFRQPGPVRADAARAAASGQSPGRQCGLDLGARRRVGAGSGAGDRGNQDGRVHDGG